MTKIVHCKKEPYDIYNTHIKDKKTKAEFIVNSREESIKKYKEYILNKPKLLNDIEELRGKVLACWCKPLSCHGDILIELLGE